MDGPRECVLSHGLIAHQGSLGRDWLYASGDAARVDQIIDFSGLGDFVNMPFRTYSSRMQLRLAFAVSTSIRPQILVLDEWLSTGDEEFHHRAEKRMREVVDSTDILILASHSRALLEENCNRVVLA